MLNRVVLIGRLTKDVELRYTQSGIAVGSFTLAVNRQFTNDNGEREADFINCVIWRKAAENFANFTGKGAPVAVEGRIQTRNYENNNGQRVYVTEVIVDNFSLIESKSEADKRRSENGTQQSTNQQAPQQKKQQKQAEMNPFTRNDGGEIDISDSDLPF